jgi:capsular exopolysaccharide synthesis family protein
LSTKEEALKKALEKKEESREEGEDLQQRVEEAVRKAISDPLTEEVEAPATVKSEEDEHTEGQDMAPDEKEILVKEPGGPLSWQGGISGIAINIKLKLGEGGKGAILFVSSVAGEGTTTLCAHVGQALARLVPGKVLLVDGNGRKPEIHKIFKTEAVPGIMEIILGKTTWAEAVRRSTIDNFYILPFGQKPAEPLLILGSRRMGELLKALKENFDLILIDAPPILSSLEAEGIASRVEHIILVIKAQSTRRELVWKAMERLRHYQEFMGAILNQQNFVLSPLLHKKSMSLQKKGFLALIAGWRPS